MGTRSSSKSSGPLARHADVVRVQLEAAGYSANSVGAHLRMLRLLDAACERKRLKPQVVTDAVIEQLVRGHVLEGRPVTLRRLQPVLLVLRSAEVIPPAGPVALDARGQLLADYRDYLLTQRRLATLTVINRSDLINRFLRSMAGLHGKEWDISQVRTADLHAFVFDHASGRRHPRRGGDAALLLPVPVRDGPDPHRPVRRDAGASRAPAGAAAQVG